MRWINGFRFKGCEKIGVMLMTEKTNSKVTGIVRRSQITRGATDNNAFQSAQISYMGRVSDTEVLWPYGMYGSVPIDSLCVTLAVGAQEENKVTLPARSHKRIRRNLKSGEVGFGNFETKSEIFFDADGNVLVIAKKDLTITVVGTATIKAANVTIDAGVVTLGARVNLGVGGLPIARVGDSVDVSGTPGVITSGSLNHTAS